MINLSKIIIIFCLIHSATTATTSSEMASCGFWNLLKIYFQCWSTFNKFDEFIANHKVSLDTNSDLDSLCQQAVDCVADFECNEAQNLKLQVIRTCEIAKLRISKNLLCLKGFFTEVYRAQFSNEKSCYNEHSFFDKNLTKRQEALFYGESCFLEYIEDHCNSTSIDYFIHNYNSFVESMTTKPAESECNYPHNFLNTVHCEAIKAEFILKHGQLIRPELTIFQLISVIKMCRDTEECVQTMCYANDFHTRMAKSCDSLESLLSRTTVYFVE